MDISYRYRYLLLTSSGSSNGQSRLFHELDGALLILQAPIQFLDAQSWIGLYPVSNVIVGGARGCATGMLVCAINFEGIVL